MPFFRPQIPYHENTKCNVFNEPPDGFPMTLTFKYYCSDLRAMTLVQYYHNKDSQILQKCNTTTTTSTKPDKIMSWFSENHVMVH